MQPAIEALQARKWAIPPLAVLLTLHEDFHKPRLAKVHRISFCEDEAEVLFEYGFDEEPKRTTCFSVKINARGAISVSQQDEEATSWSDFPRFLENEIATELAECLAFINSWRQDEHAADLAIYSTGLRLISGLLTCPGNTFEIVVKKDSLNKVLSSIQLVRSNDEWDWDIELEGSDTVVHWSKPSRPGWATSEIFRLQHVSQLIG